LYTGDLTCVSLQQNAVIDVYDVCCGTGTIAMYVADVSDNIRNIFGVELLPEAVEAAKYNANINKISNVEFIAG